MATLVSVLPAPKQAVYSPVVAAEPAEPANLALAKKSSGAPRYGSRKGWVPRTVEDFGDGGSFPEIHVVQYPLNMGRKDSESEGRRTVPVTLDSQGRIKYEAVLAPGTNRRMFARHEDLVERARTEDELRRPDSEEEDKVAQRTREALQQLVNQKVAAAQPTTAGGVQTKAGTQAQYIRYTPSGQAPGAMQSGAGSRIIRMTEAPVDPLEPPKFKHKKVPRGPPSPPVPVMHSPPRKLTVQDQQEWKIPPSISNWKNNKGYTIPLDKRLAADGRGLEELQINDNFSKLSESLYMAERNAREEVAKRAEIEKRLKLKEKEKKEEMLRRLAQEARMERASSQMVAAEDEEAEEGRRERDEIREQRRKERERDLRMQRNKSQAARNEERDVSERIALGMAMPSHSNEVQFDQRLFNQSQGMSSGFGDEDSYNIYTKPLFQGSSANQIYRPKKTTDEENYGGEEDLKKLQDTSKFKPDKGFTGVEGERESVRGGRPVEFEKDTADPFGLDEFLTQAKKGALDKVGTSGHMAVGSGNVEAAREGGSKRSRLDFEKGAGDQQRDKKRR